MRIIIYNFRDGAPELIKWKKSSNPVLRTEDKLYPVRCMKVLQRRLQSFSRG